MILAVGKVFVITGPSGVGKGTLIERLLERIPELELSVSATTRAPRPARSTGATITSSPRGVRAPRRGGRLPRARDLQRQPLRHPPRGGRAPARGGPLRRPRDRGAGRPAGARAMPEAVQIFIAPPDPRFSGSGSRAGEPTRPRAIEQRLRTAEIELAAQGGVPARGGERRPAESGLRIGAARPRRASPVTPPRAVPGPAASDHRPAASSVSRVRRVRGLLLLAGRRPSSAGSPAAPPTGSLH